MSAGTDSERYVGIRLAGRGQGRLAVGSPCPGDGIDDLPLAIRLLAAQPRKLGRQSWGTACRGHALLPLSSRGMV